MERTIQALLVAAAAGDSLTTVEQARVDRHEDALETSDDGDLEWLVEILGDLKSQSGGALRRLVRNLATQLLEERALFSAMLADPPPRADGPSNRHRELGLLSGAARRAAGEERREELRRTIEALKARGLKTAEAIRRYLRETDPHPHVNAAKKVAKIRKQFDRAKGNLGHERRSRP